MRGTKRICSVLSLFALAFCLIVPSQLLAEDETTQWLNHLDFLPGDSEITTVYNAAVGGLEVTATSTGDNFILQGAPVSPGFLVTGVRVCYELSSAGSFINQVVLAQLQDPPDSAQVLLEDLTALSDMGPICVNSSPQFGDPIDPSLGALNLGLGVNFADTVDSIAILGVGLITIPDPDSPMNQAIMQLQDDLAEVQDDLVEVQGELEDVKDGLENHTHYYLTGKGVGHNNEMVSTGSSNLTSDTPELTQSETSKKKKKKKKKNN